MSTSFGPQHDLPVGFRGYKREATDAFLAELGERQTALARECDELRWRVEDLTRELEEHQTRATAVAEALVTAQQIAVDLRAAAHAEIEQERLEVAEAIEQERQDVAVAIELERQEVAEERQRLVNEGSTIRAEAQQQATEIIREARIRGDRLVDDLMAALEEYREDTDQFLVGKREYLSSLIRELLARIPGSAPALLLENEDEGVEPPAADVAVA